MVDLGSGTGLSTRAWADRADEVVGVEASPEMRDQAEAATAAENVRFVQAYAQETGLPDGVADIVTCSQSFHWMEPEPTLAEAARILRPGGVFAAYDYDWPPVVHWEVEAAFEELVGRSAIESRARRAAPAHEGHASRADPRRAATSVSRARSCSTRATGAAPSGSSAWRSASGR